MLEELAGALWHRLPARLGYRKTAATRAATLPRLLAAARRAREAGRLEVLRPRGRLLAAVVLEPRDPDPMSVPATGGRIVWDPRSSRAHDWLRGLLPDVVAAAPEDLSLTLERAHAALLPDLLDAGLGIDAVLLLGRPRTARRGLRAHHRVLPSLAPLELQEERLEREEDIEAVLDLKRRWYRAHPEYGWFCAAPARLAAEREELRGFCRAPDAAAAFVVRDRAGALRGYFGCGLDEGGPFGRAAHMDLVLGPEVQGRGVGTYAYDRMLTEMIRRRVRVLVGGTSQPAVLRLARSMRRPLRAWMLRKAPTAFPPEHFDPVHPAGGWGGS